MSYVRGKNGIDFHPPGTGVRNNVSVVDFSGTTGETILSSVLIPANTFAATDIIDFYTLATRTGLGTGTCSLRIRIGTTQTTGDTLAGTVTVSGTRNLYLPMVRRFVISGASTNTYCLSATTSSVTHYNQTGGTSNLAINWTTNNYISVSFQAFSTTDNINVEFIKLKRFDGDSR